MTAKEAEEIANQFVRVETGKSLRLITSATADHNDPSMWIVLFEWRTSSSQKVDGPVIVRVNSITAEANFI